MGFATPFTGAGGVDGRADPEVVPAGAGAAGDADATAGETGEYVVDGLASGRYTLQVRVPGFKPHSYRQCRADQSRGSAR